ncbi:hypothetical protein ACFVZC_37465 [Streptomyces marokkonensis]|uniref:Uncharacterized protein n=1 Tax=Streptomyces marokkonensis TaxID=324855 RepID=A0ABW6QIE2_9ACTN
MTLQDQSGIVAPGLGAAGSPGPVRAVPVALGETEFGAFYHAHVDKLFAFLSRRTDRDVGKELADLVFEQKYVANLSVAECAETLGTGVDNMKKILGKARVALRRAPGMDAYNSAGTAKEVRG